MIKEEHQRIDRLIPKCKCGNNLSRQRQNENIDHCPACDVIIDMDLYYRLYNFINDHCLGVPEDLDEQLKKILVEE